MNYKLVAYAMDAASFIVQHVTRPELIKNIILFGSVARGDDGKESDIDLFIDIPPAQKRFDALLRKTIQLFEESAKAKQYWNLLSIGRPISLKIGAYAKWKELHTSIASNGILLYGKFNPKTKGAHNAVFVWENVQPNSTRVSLNKKLFGFKQKGHTYAGLLSQYNGTRLGKGCIIVPGENAQLFHDLFKKERITVRIKKFIEY